MKAILFWDIDGTLLSTGRAGIFALEDAFVEVVGKKPELDNFPTAGMTDAEIVKSILLHLDQVGDTAQINQCLRAYERRLPTSLPLKKGKVLPGVLAILEYLQTRKDIYSMLLTGNTEMGAKAKLTHYGLDHFFSEGAFSADLLDRVSIAETALKMAHAAHPNLNTDNLFVIGDTPNDIRCAKAIQAKAVAVASGGYSVKDLSAHKPWLLWESLPSPVEFCKQLQLENGLVQ